MSVLCWHLSDTSSGQVLQFCNSVGQWRRWRCGCWRGLCGYFLVRIIVFLQEFLDFKVLVGHAIIEFDSVTSDNLCRVVETLLGPDRFASFDVTGVQEGGQERVSWLETGSALFRSLEPGSLGERRSLGTDEIEEYLESSTLKFRKVNNLVCIFCMLLVAKCS